MGPQPVEDENFCLRWNDYEKKYAETFRTLREDEHFADVTLACEGHAVKAHRIILCACSGYFGHILRTINPAQVSCSEGNDGQGTTLDFNFCSFSAPSAFVV